MGHKGIFVGCDTSCKHLRQDDDGSYRCLEGWFSSGTGSDVYQQCDPDCEDYSVDTEDEDDDEW